MVNKKKNKVKLLIITQKVDENDDVLGFFHRWIEEFAKHCEQVTVICLYEGQHHLPKNVKVLSLGKEKYFRKRCDLRGGACDGKRSLLEEKIFSKIIYIYRFYKYIWQEHKNYDAVFVHMNQIYVILGGIFWRLFRKKIGFWYAHGHVSLSLRIAEKISDIIFTSTESGFRVQSKKIKIVGQGIDTDIFTPPNIKKKEDKFNIISVGRISPVKDYETLISAIGIIIKKNIPIRVCMVGDAGTSEQKKYLSSLVYLISKRKLEKVFSFVGSIANKNLPQYLQKSDMFVNMSHTGSLDKAILEAMATGIPVVTCNEAIVNVLGDDKDKLMFKKGDANDFAGKIIEIKNMTEQQKDKIVTRLRGVVVQNHNLSNFVKKIINHL